MQHKKPKPRVFISYSWDNDEHKDWVLTLADKLKEDGVDVKLDRYDMYAGRNLHTFIEENIEKADKIVVVFTPMYRQKAEGRKKYAGAEYSIINVGLYQEIASQEKIIPIFRLGSLKECLPLFMQQFLSIDFSDTQLYQEKYKELLRAIYKTSQIESSSEAGKNSKPTAGKSEWQTRIVTFFNKRNFWASFVSVLSLIAALITIWQYMRNDDDNLIHTEPISSLDSPVVTETPKPKEDNDTQDTPANEEKQVGITEVQKSSRSTTAPIKKHENTTNYRVEYDNIGFPVNGICLVEKQGRYGFINSDSNNINGSKVVELKYDFAEDFSEGMAQVKRHGLYGYINTTGELVINYQFDYAWSFIGGIAKVRKGGESFSINKHGERIDNH